MRLCGIFLLFCKTQMKMWQIRHIKCGGLAICKRLSNW